MSSEIEETFDPVRAEVLRRRLYNIASGMGTVMIRVSGNPVVAEAVDFSTFVADSMGEVISFSGYMLMHFGPARSAIKYIIDTYPEDDINEGDQFMCNDPFTTSGCHQPDVALIKPVFYGGKRVAWTWAEGHMLDIGGVAPGGFAPMATDVYGEAIRWPGIKFVKNGKVIDDLKRLFTTNVRLPVRVFNDVRALIAANNHGSAALLDTIKEFGIDDFERYNEINKDLSEKAMRDVISKLPDGKYRASTVAEHDGHENNLYPIVTEVGVDGDEVTIDFTGTAEQAPGFINCTLPVTLGAVINGPALWLAPDVPINEGMVRPIKIIAPEGCIMNAVEPAQCSSGHMEAGARSGRALIPAVMSVMQKSDDKIVREHASASFQDDFLMNIIGGANQYGDDLVFMDMNGGGGGGPAQTTHDGLDVSGTCTQLQQSLPDLEMNERENPVFFLYRKLNKNSGGAGKYRGGLGIDYAWILHDVGEAMVITCSICQQVPGSGTAGGYPYSTALSTLIRNSNVHEMMARNEIPGDSREIEGTKEELPAKTYLIPIDADTVFCNKQGGGSGLLDPLLREKEIVAKDVKDRYITIEHAKKAYGVIVSESGGIDEQKTEEARKEIRNNRLSWSYKKKLSEKIGETSFESHFSHAINIVSSGGKKYLQCIHCGNVFAPFVAYDSTEWVDYTRSNDSRIDEWAAKFDMYIQKREEGGEEEICLREQCCPNCGTMFETVVLVKGM